MLIKDACPKYGSVSASFNIAKTTQEFAMLAVSEKQKFDQMQNAYKAAVEEWIAVIKQEEALASVNHDVAEVDKWEAAHFKEEEVRSRVKAAKRDYEDALRKKFFGF
jgi:hypothetical protein